MRNKYKNIPNQALVDRLKTGNKECIDSKEAQRRSKDNIKKFAAKPNKTDKKDNKKLNE